MDLAKIEKAVEDLLEAIGEKGREGTRETPKRVAKMFKEMLEGKYIDAVATLEKRFNVDTSDIVIVKGIFFNSMCEHHLMPFFGKITIAYVPNGKVVGLSKLARVVEIFSHRLQLQEQLTSQIGEAIFSSLKPPGIIVICKAVHTCMVCRGVRKLESETLTYFKKGTISEQQVQNMINMS